MAPFKGSDRVAFVGNSITDGGHYHSYIWLYYMTRFPEARMQMFNCGIGGDTSLEILRRIDHDVFAKRPTVLTLTFGMNDSGYFEYNGDNPGAFADSKVAESRRNFLEIEKKLKEHTSVRKVMIGTSPYDQTSRFNDNIFKGKNDAMRRIIAFQDSAARANGWEFVDFNAPMCAINSRFQAADSTFTLCGSDRVHPDNDGHMVMAWLFLKAQGMAGKKMAEVAVDASRSKVMTASGCKVTRLKTEDGRLSAKDIMGNKKKLTWWQDEFWKHMVKKFPDLERGESASQTGRDHIPPRVFKEMTRLTKQKDKLEDLLTGINPFNAKSRAEEICKILDTYIPSVEKMDTLLRKYGVAFTKTASENKKLKTKNAELEESLASAQKVSTLKQIEDLKLRRDYDSAVAILEQIPAEVLNIYAQSSYRGKERPIEQSL